MELAKFSKVQQERNAVACLLILRRPVKLIYLKYSAIDSANFGELLSLLAMTLIFFKPFCLNIMELWFYSLKKMGKKSNLSRLLEAL